MLPKFKKNSFADKVSKEVKPFDIKKVLMGLMFAGTVATASTQLPDVQNAMVNDVVNTKKASLVMLAPQTDHQLVAWHSSHSSHSSHVSHESHSSHYSSSY